MSITFDADSVTVEGARNTQVSVIIHANGRKIAEQLELDDRLYDLDPVDIINEVGVEKILESIDEDIVRKWLLENTDPDDTLEFIGLDKIHEYLRHDE